MLLFYLTVTKPKSIATINDNYIEDLLGGRDIRLCSIPPPVTRHCCECLIPRLPAVETPI